MSKIAFIGIHNMKIDVVLGVFEWEKNVRQQIILNGKIEYDTAKAIKSDNIKDAFDYFELMTRIKKEVEETRFELLEKLVDFVLDIIMSYKKAISAEVRIQKVEPVKELTESISITGFRSRKKKR